MVCTPQQERALIEDATRSRSAIRRRTRTRTRRIEDEEDDEESDNIPWSSDSEDEEEAAEQEYKDLDFTPQTDRDHSVASELPVVGVSSDTAIYSE